MRVVGVDGCPGGWVAIEWDTEAGTLTPRVYTSIAALLGAHADAQAIGIDIPIGLAEGRPRGADVEARRVLEHRRSSVFPAPDPRLLDELNYAEAGTLSRSLTGKGISKQSHAIFPKVAEVNRALTPEMQDRVFEVHPEVSFWALAGRPMEYSKGKPEGFEERRQLLADALGVAVWSRIEARSVARPAEPDDVLDAVVAAWSAHRLATGQAGRLPAIAETDGRGLRMEIVH